MHAHPLILVINAVNDGAEIIEEYLPDWRSIRVTVDDDGAIDIPELPQLPSVIAIFAHDNEETTKVMCKQLQNDPTVKSIPVLLVINRYLISQTSALDGARKSGVLIEPIEQDELEQKIKVLTKESQW